MICASVVLRAISPDSGQRAASRRGPLSLVLAGMSLAVCLPASSLVLAQSTRADRPMPSEDAHARPIRLLEGFGHWGRSVTTRDPLAQRYFDQGLRLYYASEIGAAFRSFKEAQRLDPDCVMCVWGAALTRRPARGAATDTATEQQAIRLARRGLLLLNRVGANDRERALVRAIAVRHLDLEGHRREERDSAYARAMARLAAQASDDADILVLAAEAALPLARAAYWNADHTPTAATVRIVEWLERAMRVAPDHPGACHLYLHVMEAAYPQRAVDCAVRLSAQMPSARYLLHLPTHLFVALGRWRDAVDGARQAEQADARLRRVLDTELTAASRPEWRAHNLQTMVLASVMMENRTVAMDGARRLTELLSPSRVRASPDLEPMMATQVQALVAYNQWDRVLRAALPPPSLRTARALYWQARGMAFTAAGRTSEARATLDSVRAQASTLPQGDARRLLRVAECVLQSELALRSGDASTAVHHLGEAVANEDSLAQRSFAVWFVPTRQLLGRALLAAGRAADARAIYEEDLARFPENGRSLAGLAKALRAEGRDTDAAAVEERLTAVTGRVERLE